MSRKKSVHAGTRNVVYFIRYGETRWIKIGWASDLVDRLGSLQCASPEHLTVEASVSAACADERALHRALREHRGRREWFKPTPLVRLVVEMAAHGRTIAELIAFAKSPEPADEPSQRRLRQKLFYERSLLDETLNDHWRDEYKSRLREIEIEDRVKAELSLEATA